MIPFRLEDALTLLGRTPRVLVALLEELPSDWETGNEGEGTWSPFDVVGHLIHGEKTDWIPRARIILEHGETRAFEPFDRSAQFEANRGKTLQELLQTFDLLRGGNVETLRGMNLQPEDLKKAGRHPELGRATLGELLATWVAHDQDHIVQLSRTLANQYRDSVGPWRAYLSVIRKD